MAQFLEDKNIDIEWVALLEEAQELGLSIDEVREFLMTQRMLHAIG